MTLKSYAAVLIVSGLAAILIPAYRVMRYNLPNHKSIFGLYPMSDEVVYGIELWKVQSVGLGAIIAGIGVLIYQWNPSGVSMSGGGQPITALNQQV